MHRERYNHQINCSACPARPPSQYAIRVSLNRIQADEDDHGLKKLEYLSLVSKLCTDLETHLGFGDRNLAEFLAGLGRNCHTVREFHSKLKQNGAEFSDSSVRTPWTVIHAILAPPNRRKKEQKQNHPSNEPEAEKKIEAAKYKALAIPDDKGRVKALERDIEIEAKEKARKGSDANELEMYKVYEGRVSRVMASGCFVQLSDFWGKEGLVHVSQIADRGLLVMPRMSSSGARRFMSR